MRAAVTFGERPVKAQNTKTASFFRYQRPFDGLFDQIAHGLTEGQTMALRMRFRHLHGVVLELQRRSWHVNIISLL